MKPTDTLTTLFSHNLWANLRLLECCAVLSSEQLDATISGTYGSIHDTLEHIVNAEHSYFSRISTGQRWRRPENAPPLTMAEMRESVQCSGTGLIEWAIRVQPGDTVPVDWGGKPRDVPKSILLSQAINHATEHRAQVMAILTQLGIEPPELDSWTYFNERDKPQPDGYLAIPTTGTGEGVLVLHAWWGLNDTIKAFCRRLAESGFVAFAPDLYHGKVADTIAGAETLIRALEPNFLQTKSEIADAVMFLREWSGRAERGIAVIGFSMGVYYALDLAAADPKHIRSVVIFYGTGDGDYNNSQAAYLGHFAQNDEFEPQSSVDSLKQSLRAAGRPVTFHHYSGTGHWFFEPDRSGVYDPAAASLAWERTLAFLKRE